MSAERLRRFFKREHHHAYRIEKSIRDMCVFARQNLVADPPFSHVDLISCRNVLIYMSQVLQQLHGPPCPQQPKQRLQHRPHHESHSQLAPGPTQSPAKYTFGTS